MLTATWHDVIGPRDLPPFLPRPLPGSSRLPEPLAWLGGMHCSCGFVVLCVESQARLKWLPAHLLVVHVLLARHLLAADHPAVARPSHQPSVVCMHAWALHQHPRWRWLAFAWAHAWAGQAVRAQYPHELHRQGQVAVVQALLHVAAQGQSCNSGCVSAPCCGSRTGCPCSGSATRCSSGCVSAPCPG